MKAVQTPIGLVVCAHPTVLRYDTCEEGRPGATNYEILGSDQSTWINPGDTLTVDVPCKTCSTCHRERRSWDSPCTCGYAYGGPPPLVIGTVSRTVRVVKVLPICKSFPIGGEHDYRHHPNATAVLVVFDQATELWTWNDRAIELPRRRTVDLPDASPGGVALIVEVVEQT